MPQPEDRAAANAAGPAATPGTARQTALPCDTSLTPGSVLAERFRIIRYIAGGGMGQVFEAFDTVVGERVALKLIKPELLSDGQARERFLREVQTARRVTHPNVCRTFDVFEHRPDRRPGDAAPAPERTFLSMELLEGETLAARLARGRLTTGEALPIVEQMAAALAAAHEAGIIHRDFKCRNVILVGTGAKIRAVVTDFGLSRATGDETASLTGPGALPGTPAYMAPEQLTLRGEVTPSADIYALGLVMYEMVTGHRPFETDHAVQEIVARLTEKPPPPRVHEPRLDPAWEAAILRCLERDPKDRFADARDVARAVAPEKRRTGTGFPRRRAARAALAVLLLSIAAGIGSWLAVRQRSTAPRTLELTRLNFDPGAVLQAEISPDGRLVAFVSDRGGNFDVWVQQVNGRQPLRLTSHEALDWMPAFSPDGSEIAFRSERDGGGIYVVETLGGRERKLADGGWFPRFSPDRSMISFCRSAAWFDPRFNKMFLVAAKGGTPSSFQPEFGGAEWPLTSGPIWSPDGKHLLFAGQRGDDSATWEWYVAPVAGGTAVETGALALVQKQLIGGVHAPSAWRGDFVYFSSGTSPEGVNVFRLRLKPGTWRAEGPAEQLTSGPGVRPQSSLALDGRMVFPIVNVSYDISRLDVGPGGAAGTPKRFELDASTKRDPAVDHDGQRLLYSAYAGREQPARLEIRLRDLASGAERIYYPSGTTLSTYPRISADGTAFVYGDWIDGERRSFLVDSVTATSRELCRQCRVWGFFNRSKAFVIRGRAGVPQRLAPDTGNLSDLITPSTLRVLDVDLSWDDSWLVVHAGKPDGDAALCAVPVGVRPTPESEWRLLFESSRWLGSPRWSPDGTLVYFLSESDGMRCVYAQRLNAETKAAVGTPFAVMHAHQNRTLMMGFRGSLNLEVARNFLVLTTTDAWGSAWMTTVEGR